MKKILVLGGCTIILLFLFLGWVVFKYLEESDRTGCSLSEQEAEALIESYLSKRRETYQLHGVDIESSVSFPQELYLTGEGDDRPLKRRINPTQYHEVPAQIKDEFGKTLYYHFVVTNCGSVHLMGHRVESDQ